MIAPEPIAKNDFQPISPAFNRGKLWADFADSKGAVLVVGHGTRNSSGALQLRDLVFQMQIKEPLAKISGCFLELANPSIEQAIEELHSIGMRKILVVPVLLFTAAHALEDIPDAVSQAASRFGIEVIGQTGSLGTHPSVVSLSQTRYFEIRDLEQGYHCPEKACARVECSSGRCEGQNVCMGRIGLAMVGRGTSDPSALEHMRSLTDLKVVQLNPVRFQTGFFAGGKPNVDGLLEEASAWDCDTVLVQPHLLFEGELIEQLRSKVLECQRRFSSKHWFVARTLGADPKLADVFLELAIEQLASKSLSPSKE